MRPIFLAVFKLMTSSNFVGCSTGSSSGLAPLRILSTYGATFDFLEHTERATTDLVTWVNEGKIAHREDIREGFDNIPATFFRLFSGKNEGKQLLKLADPE